MADETEKKKGFSVRDRRTSQREGETSASPKGTKASEGVEAGTTTKADVQEPPASPSAAEGDPSSARVDFSTFLLSLLSSVLIHLGDMPDPITGKVHVDLASAKHTIDILDILKAKTHGNLDEEEDRLLRTAAAELKWKYLDALKKNG